MQDQDKKGVTEMILGYCGNNITLTLSPPPSKEVAPPPRELNSAVIPTIPRSEESIVSLGVESAGGSELEKKVAELEEKVEALLEANKEKPAKTWPITYDNRYRTLTKFAMDPVGLPETTGSDLMNKITLPDSVYTSVWLIPLIDSRLWYGEPAKKFTDLTPQLQEKYATKELNKGSANN